VESFPVICETCGARLKVRDERLIGEIHACPKCDSMVHIMPPAEWKTGALQQSAIRVDTHPQPSSEVVASAAVVVEVAVPPAAVAATTSPIIAWLVVGALLLLAGLAIGMWIGGEGADVPVEPVPKVAETKTDNENAVELDPYAVASPAEAADRLAAVPDPPLDMVEQAPSDGLPTPQRDELTKSPVPTEQSVRQQAAELDVEKPERDAVQAPAKKPDDQPIAENVPPSDRPQSPVLRFDPLDFDSAKLSSSTGASSSSSLTDSLRADSGTDLVLEAPAEDAIGEPAPPLARDRTLHVRLGPTPMDAARQDKSRGQLSLRIASFAIRDVPLTRFVAMLTDMANVSIALDPRVLAQAGVSPRAAVSIEATGATIEDLLRDALAKHRLELAENDGRTGVVVAGGETWRVAEYEIKDLAAQDDAKGVADLIQHFVAPEAWHSAGGKGTVTVDGTRLRIEQRQAVHREIIVFCERLRLARGLAPRSRYPVELLSVDSPDGAISKKLDKTVTFTILPWSRFADVVHFWQESSGLTILVDWQALADMELGPSTPLACSATSRRWDEVFDGVLEPVGLAWWAVDGDTIQITSRDALTERQRVEFFAVPDSLRAQFASQEAFIASLPSTLGELATGNESAGASIRMAIDAPSGRLIVLASPAVHRFLSERLRSEGDRLSKSDVR
jgi:hypothetical protein